MHGQSQEKNLQDLFGRGKFFEGVDWSQTKAYAVGLGQIYFNLKGREAKGIVSAGEEYRKLQDEIRDKLLPLKDPETGDRVFQDLYKRDDIYKGEYIQMAPDLQVGFLDGYRVGWQDTLGTIRRGVVENNNRKWSGDHCATATEISHGVLFANRRIASDVAAHHGSGTLDPEAARGARARGLRRQAALVTSALLVVALLAAPQEPPAAQPAPTAPASPQHAPAATDDDRLRKVQERRAALEQELKKMRGEEKSLLGEVEQLELELQLRSDELVEIQISLKRTRAQLDATVLRVKQLETSLAEARPALARHARALYKLGDTSYLRLLLSIERPADFFRGYRLITTLARRDNARVAQFRVDLAAHTTEKAALEKRTQESIALRNKLAAARHNLDAQRARKTELLTSLVERKELNAAYLDELGQAETRLSQMLSGLGEESVAVPLGAFRGSLPWPTAGPVREGFGRRKHPRFDTYTVHNGIEIAAAADAPVRVVHEGRVRLRRPFPRLRPAGRRGPRRQALLALRTARRARRVQRTGRARRQRARARRSRRAGRPRRVLRDAVPGTARRSGALALETLIS